MRQSQSSLLLLLMLCLLLCSCSTKQDITLLKNVKLFDGEVVREQVDIVISDGIIVHIGGADTGLKPTQVIDGAGKTVVPLLVNAHAHVHAPEQLRESLAQGIGTVLDLYTSAEKATQFKALNDSLNYATYYTSGPGATAPGGHGTQLGYAVPNISSASEAGAFVQDRVKEGSDFIKIIREPMRPTLDYETIHALTEAAHQNGKPVVVHISTLADALPISKLKVDGFAHIWVDKALDEEQLAQLTIHKPFIIPTLYAIQKLFLFAEQQGIALHYLPVEDLQKEVYRLHQSKLLILAGTDAPNLGINFHDDLLEELKMLKASGMSDLEVLKAATINPAKAFGFLNQQLISAQKQANFLLIDGDPTNSIESLRNLEGIWRKGKRLR